ncbi:MAG: Na+/H+ antiporter NhaC [Rhodothermales bacterium]|nr:Na+/H+ antiporter NhaC [Rhodothermales bacterium]MBO6779221.1 Na+/H+ antiporter NhaC [Rhodothermales bacterium]
MSSHEESVPFWQAATPVAFLLLLIAYGLMARPLFLDQPPFPLELVFVGAAAFAVAHLRWLGHAWADIQASVVARLAKAMPALFILFAIGLLIAAWMVSGTIPMLVFYGIAVIQPSVLYPLAFLVPVVFSTLTGTSWGSAGTIGVVIMGVGLAAEANPGILAGAIIGGAYFGDKLSPLSDTTNIAALGADVELFEHIRSMLWTTVPSAVIALSLYIALGLTDPPGSGASTADADAFTAALGEMFTFSPLLLLPPAVVLWGSMRRYPTIPVLISSILVATLLAVLLQPFPLADVLTALNSGFSADMATWMATIPDGVRVLVERGGLYSMSAAIFTAFLVFFYIGAIDRIDAMPVVVNRVFRFARTQSATVLAALGATAVTNAMTSNQYATSFIVGDAFGKRFDALGVPRKVLSRSLEDTGTMLESLVPWHATALFMVATLGVPVADYWHWQFLSLVNFVVAPVLAITGIGCYYRPK